MNSSFGYSLTLLNFLFGELALPLCKGGRVEFDLFHKEEVLDIVLLKL